MPTEDAAFTEAVQVLGDLKDLDDQETLGIAGGIYKRRWDTFGQLNDLKQASAYYTRGWDAALADDGYTGINAAYVFDVLAFNEETVAKRAGAAAPATALRLRTDARRIRETIVAQAKELDRRATTLPHAWWILVTLAEAHFGLAPADGAHYIHAEAYLRRALDLETVAPVEDWMVETTARQLGSMARMQEAALPPAAQADSRPWQVLEVLAKKVPSLRTELGAKVGLALSGGGFRASLFHIGVLARLAELDLLRHVEVLSCVSGGSILGAAYYLRLRELLTRKRDDEISRDDYIAMVADLETEFLRAIQENNFRLRMVERFTANLQMLGQRASRTEALGRAMGEGLYGSTSIQLHDLQIEPPDAGQPGFRPADYNWRRRNKVPLLVLTATNHADGHGWHFTPYEMGEPQLSAIDCNPRLAPRPLRPGDSVHLWRAVSASACVPVLFEPIAVPFGGEIVNLLDGGVHDNQGTSALLANDCTLLLVSDASGQLTGDATAATSFAAVGARADGIVQERLRIALYETLASRRRGSLLRGMMFLHLRLGLRNDDAVATDYGVPTGVQRRLSAIRTDLDVFNDAEALSLMASGYLMTRQQLGEQLPMVRVGAPKEHVWSFRAIEPSIATQSPRLLELLDLGASRFLKAWRAVPLLRWTGLTALAVLALAGLGLLAMLLLSDRVLAIPVSTIAWTILSGLAAAAAARYLRVKAPNWHKEAAFIVLAIGGAALAKVHAKWLDRAYIRVGHRSRFSG
jgi:predicted acylesterase/phospholipase RssA